MMSKWRLLKSTTLAVCMVSLLACGGSSGGGSGGGGVGIGLLVFYSPIADVPTAGNVSLRRSAASTPGNLILEVIVYGSLDDVYGMAFHLSYDKELINFVSASKINILDDGTCSGACILFSTDDDQPDLLIVGMSRTGAVGGVNLPDGANVIMTLQFTGAMEGGPSGISFVDPHTTSVVNDSTLTDISGTWTGGSISVQ